MKTFKLSYFVMGIVAIFVALLAFRNPELNLIAVVWMFALMAIVKGIFELFFRRKTKEFDGNKHTWIFILGIVDLLLGIFLVINIGAGLLALPYVFAFWFIFDSLMELMIYSSFAGTTYYWFHLVLNILGIMIGFFLLFHPIIAALSLSYLVGIYFMISGILSIVYSFQNQ